MAKKDCSNMLQTEHGYKPEAADKLLEDLKKIGSPEEIIEAADEFAQLRDFQIEQRKLAPDLMQHIYEKAYNFISEGAKSSDEAIQRFKALLTGSTKEGEGFLKSVGTEQESRVSLMHGRIQTDFLNKTGLSRTEMHKLFMDENFQMDVVKERFPFAETSVTNNEKAHILARIFEQENLRVVQEANNAGAAINYNPEHVTIQYHNTVEMKMATENEWIKFTLGLLDERRTFKGFKPDPDNMKEIFRRLTADKEIKAQAGESISDSLSASRVLHFKNADAWLTYNKRFGHQNPLQAMIEGLELQSDRTVLIKRLGPDPFETLDTLKDSIAKDFNISKAIFESSGINTRIDVITGRSFIPENPSITKWVSRIQNWHIITDMGKAMLSSFGDPMTQAITMNFHGKSFLSAYHDTFRNLRASFSKNMTPEEKNMFKYLGIGIDGILSSASTRYIASDRVSGSLSKYADQMFIWNGLNYWTNANREGFARMNSAYMGDQALIAWNNLSDSYQRVLKQYDINQKDWDLVNKAGPYNIAENAKLQNKPIDVFVNERYFTPDHLRNFSASKHADELATKLEIFFVNEARIAVPQPGKNEKAIMSFGFKRGTVPGALAELFWLFRSFPLTMAVQQYPRMKQNGIGNSALHLAPAIMLGYASLTAKDLFRGREPKDPFAASTAAASLIQSGVAGIVGDFIYNNFSSYNYGWPEIIFGPVAGDFRDAGRLFSGLVNGREDAAKAWSAVKSNIPFANLFYLEPAINYGFIYHIQEYVNPGYLGRMENSIRNLENQDYIEAFRPSAVVGGY